MTTNSPVSIRLSDEQKTRLADAVRMYAAAHGAFMSAVDAAAETLGSIARDLDKQFSAQSMTWRRSPAGTSTAKWISRFEGTSDYLGQIREDDDWIHTWFQQPWTSAPEQLPATMTAAHLQPGDRFKLLDTGTYVHLHLLATYLRTDGPLDNGAVNLWSGSLISLMPDMIVTLVENQEDLNPNDHQ